MSQEIAHTGFVYDTKRKKYISQKTGKPVKAALILYLLRKLIQDAEDRQHRLAIEFYEKRIAPATFIETTCTEQRRNTILCMALAVGGFAMLTQAMLSKSEFVLQGTYVKIVGSTQDVLSRGISLPQLLNRVDSYVGEARLQYYQALRDNATTTTDNTTIIVRRIIDPGAKSCQDCLDYYSLGWQTLDSDQLPEPGERCQCRGNCRCDRIEREVPTAELDGWLGTMRG